VSTLRRPPVNPEVFGRLWRWGQKASHQLQYWW
jgi:hypothetical protein